MATESFKIIHFKQNWHKLRDELVPKLQIAFCWVFDVSEAPWTWAERTRQRRRNSRLLQTQSCSQAVWLYLGLFYTLKLIIRFHWPKELHFSKLSKTVLKTAYQIQLSHFADEKRKAHGGKLTFPWPHKRFVTDLESQSQVWWGKAVPPLMCQPRFRSGSPCSEAPRVTAEDAIQPVRCPCPWAGDQCWPSVASDAGWRNEAGVEGASSPMDERRTLWVKSSQAT